MANFRSQGGLRSAAVFCLCALFAILAMGLALLSSGVYRSAVADSDTNYTHRTVLSYLVNQVRRADEANGIALGSFGGYNALALNEAGTDNVTYLYCYDGQLRELYMERGTGLRPEDGIAIISLQDLTFTASGASIEIAATSEDGTIYTASISPRCGFEEVDEL